MPYFCFNFVLYNDFHLILVLCAQNLLKKDLFRKFYILFSYIYFFTVFTLFY